MNQDRTNKNPDKIKIDSKDQPTKYTNDSSIPTKINTCNELHDQQSTECKYDVNLKLNNKYKRPQIEVQFNSSDDTVKFADNEYLKTYNLKWVWRQCISFDIKCSNTYKWLIDGMKVDELRMKTVIDKIASIN